MGYSVIPLTPQMDALGPLARTVEDAAILLGCKFSLIYADSLTQQRS